MKSFAAYALEGFPMVNAGDDIARIVLDTCERNGFVLQDGDVVVAAQKIFSKAEGRVISVRNIVPSVKAKKLAKVIGKSSKFVELVLRETKRILKCSPEILLVEDNRGLVCINAGIDKSNIQGDENFALLPENPDLSARNCCSELESLTGKKLAVLICDTYSRPFRRGQVNFAIGSSGLSLFRDYRGKRDLFGHVLKVKNVAVVDEIAGAAELLMGQGGEASPVVVVRDINGSFGQSSDFSIRDLFISENEDLFRGVL
jgi:coenzyme F420-0:L-glutamate ligase / coenzyme F420-1:gamma-L-glutamate ligase